MSDSNVALCVHGVVLEAVVLLVRLTFRADNCAVQATASPISDLFHFDLMWMLLRGRGDCLLLLVTSRPCTKVSICFHAHCPAGISGWIKQYSLRGGRFLLGTYGLS